MTDLTTPINLLAIAIGGIIAVTVFLSYFLKKRANARLGIAENPNPTGEGNKLANTVLPRATPQIRVMTEKSRSGPSDSTGSFTWFIVCVIAIIVPGLMLFAFGLNTVIVIFFFGVPPVVGVFAGFMFKTFRVSGPARDFDKMLKSSSGIGLHVGTDDKARLVGARRGACLVPSEVVYTPSGVLRAGDLVEGQEIIGGHIGGLHRFEDDLFELKTFNYGITLQGNGEHPVYISNRGTAGRGRSRERWASLKDIATDLVKNQTSGGRTYALLLNPHSLKFQEKSVGQAKAKLLGYMLSDGHRNPHGFEFSNTNGNFVSEVSELSVQCGYSTTYSWDTHHGKLMGRLFITQSKGLREQYDELSITADSLGMLQMLPENELEQFVSGFFNGDGCVVPGKHMIYFAVGVPLHRAEELQFMLWRLGIRSTKRFKHYGTSVEGYWEVSVFDIPSIKRLVSFLDRKKYPSKFAALDTYVEQHERSASKISHLADARGVWVQISSVVPIGRGEVIGWTTEPTHEIVCSQGLLTHNTGRWHFPNMEITADAIRKAIYPFYGNVLAIIHSSTDSMLNLDFLYYATVLNRNSEKIGDDGRPKLSHEIADTIQLMVDREEELMAMQEQMRRIANGEVTLADVLDERYKEVLYPKAPRDMSIDAEALESLTTYWKGMMLDDGWAMKIELAEIARAMTITVEETGYHIEWEKDMQGRLIGGHLVHDRVIDMHDFRNHLPTGGTAESSHLQSENARMAGALESGVSQQQYMKWLLLIMTPIIVGVSIVLIVYGLKQLG